MVAGHQERTSNIFRQQLNEEGVDAAVYRSKRDLPSFRGKILDFHRQLLVEGSPLLSASLLEPRGESRKARFLAVKKLYALQSKAVHGEPLSRDKSISAMNDSFDLLRALLLFSVEKGHAFGASDFDTAVFE